MLTRIAAAAISACLLAVAIPVGAGLAAGSADDPGGGVTCPPNSPVCVITVRKPGTSGHRPPIHSRDGSRVCTIPDGLLGAGDVVPCTDKDFGSWNSADGCYYMLASPQPPKSASAWEGHTTGAIYETTCFGLIGTGGGEVWRATPPSGLGTATPEELAQRAIKLLPIQGPYIGLAPEPGRQGLVGLPVWMWTKVTSATWGPATATAAVPGLSVTATAQAIQVVWSMGDGGRVTCTGPGTPYTSVSGDADSPDCGHTSGWRT